MTYQTAARLPAVGGGELTWKQSSVGTQSDDDSESHLGTELFYKLDGRKAPGNNSICHSFDRCIPSHCTQTPSAVVRELHSFLAFLAIDMVGNVIIRYFISEW